MTFPILSKLRGILIGLLALVLVLAAVLLVNTWRLGSLPPAAAQPLPAPADLDAAAQRFAGAVRIPTISLAEGGAEASGQVDHFPELHAYLAQCFPLIHSRLHKDVVNGRSLLFTWPGSDAKLQPVLLTAHLDVVPIEPTTAANWMHAPFSGDIADGFVWGRGSQDMKHIAMAMLESVEHLLAQGYQPRRTVLIALGHDEEISGRRGADAIADLLQQRGVRAQFSLDEGSAILSGVIPGMQRPIAQIGLSEKGYLTLLLTAHAKGGHSSMPPPQTAVGKIGRAVARLEKQQMPATLEGPGGAGLRALAPAMPFSMRVVVANEWLFGPLLKRQLSKSRETNALIRTTTAPTMIDGGVKDNVLPSEATAVVNFRLAPGDTVEQVKAHVKAVIDDDDVSIAEQGGAGSAATPVADANGPGFQLLSQVIARIAPDAVVVPGLVVTATDSRHYGRVSDAAYRFAPARMDGEAIARIHGVNERMDIRNYGEMIAFYTELVARAAR